MTCKAHDVAGYHVKTDLLAGASRRRRLMTALVVAALATSFSMMVRQAPALAATVPPPLLDITRQCETIARRNVTAMSECVVAESEARAEILQKWHKFSDTAADKCIKLGKKSRKFPYSAMAECLAEPVEIRTSAPPAAKAR